MLAGGSWYRPIGSGDWATWVQAIGTVAAFFAVAFGLRQERVARQKMEHLRKIAICGEFLAAVKNFSSRAKLNFDLFESSSITQSEVRQAILALVGESLARVRGAQIALTFLGDVELSKSAERLFESLHVKYTATTDSEAIDAQFRSALADFEERVKVLKS